MYNLNYKPTTLGVQSWREIISWVCEQKRLNTTGVGQLYLLPFRTIKLCPFVVTVMNLHMLMYSYLKNSNFIASFCREVQSVRSSRQKCHILMSSRFTHIRIRNVVNKPVAYTHYKLNISMLQQMLEMLSVLFTFWHLRKKSIFTSWTSWETG
jgi:hypothetical protein